MQRLLLIFLLFPSALSVQSQDFGSYVPADQANAILDPFGYIGAGAGVSMPIGEFRTKDFHNFYAGYAQDGFAINALNFNYRFSEHFGTGMLVYTSGYGFSVEDFLEPHRLYNPGLGFSGESDDWKLQTFAGVFTVSVPSEFFDFDVRFAAGLGRITRPELRVNISGPALGPGNIYWQQEEVTNAEFLLGFGANLRLHVFETIDALLAADYQRMRTRFDVRNYYNGTFDREEKLDQTIEVVNISAGLAWRFNL